MKYNNLEISFHIEGPNSGCKYSLFHHLQDTVFNVQLLILYRLNNSVGYSYLKVMIRLKVLVLVATVST